MRRLLSVLAVLLMLAVSCTQEQGDNGTQNGIDASPGTDGQAAASALADWGLLDELAGGLGLTDEQKTELAGEIESDGADDMFHPNPDAEFTPTANIDIARVVAFHVDLTQAQVDELFNATEYPCSTDLSSFPSTWCPPETTTFAPGNALVACGELAGAFPYETDDPETNYEYVFSFPHPESDRNYRSTFENDLFIGAFFAIGVRYSASGPEVFAWDSQRGFLAPDAMPAGVRVIVDLGGSQSSVCLVAEVAHIGTYPGYPVRWASFCGNFNRGAADWYPEDRGFLDFELMLEF